MIAGSDSMRTSPIHTDTYIADYSDIRLPPVAMREGRQQRRQQRAQATHSRISNAEGEGHESTGQILEQRGRLGEKSEDTLFRKTRWIVSGLPLGFLPILKSPTPTVAPATR